MTLHQRQQGFSLIELLVALSINLVIVIAAAYMYLGTADAKRALDQQQNVNENGQYALDMIGRDIINAGFYPSYLGTGTRKTYQDDVISKTTAAFNNGIFGCSGQSFGIAAKTCAAHAVASVTADTIVVNYYTNDAMGRDIGQRVDCNRVNVATAGENTGRTSGVNSAPAGPVPLAGPLFVSNRYTLVTTTFVIDDQSISTQSLACNGNGGLLYQPAVPGIEALQFRYGVYTDFKTLQPDRYYAASAMAGLGSVFDDSGNSRDAWSRVVSVEICIVARALQVSKTSKADGTVTPYVNCAGTTVTPTDKFVRRVYRKIYALRNNLTQTILPAS